jgi:hypothetical protein
MVSDDVVEVDDDDLILKISIINTLQTHLPRLFDRDRRLLRLPFFFSFLLFFLSSSSFSSANRFPFR